jgi:3-methyladenine DNA glycosylase AlkD
MTSAEFYQRFRSGELGDDMDFVEWSVFWDMRQATKRRLNELTKVKYLERPGELVA